jgi:hypothetical protein
MRLSFQQFISSLQRACLEVRQWNNFFFLWNRLEFYCKNYQVKSIVFTYHQNNFEISALDPLGKHVKKAYIPAFFIAA